jgi:putative ABC transport system permease protein
VDFFTNLLPTTQIALQALAKNKMRASLTVLGIVIGVAAVTTLVSIGQSASYVVQGQLEGLGTNLIIIASAAREEGGVRGGPGGTPTLTVGDAEAVASQCHGLLAVSPAVGAMAQAVYGNTNWHPREMLGVAREYLVVRNWELRLGGFFTDRDITSGAKVCVIGQTIVEKLFQTTNPLGRSIRVQNIPLTVIGVLEPKGTNILGMDQDDIILAPYTTVRSRLKGSHFDKVDVIFCSARSQEQMADAEMEIRQLLNERHRIRTGDPADFEVKNIAEIANMLGVIAGAMTALLSSIAAIALLVGGVGIMNIMLVSVTERTREIGIRMAVGAHQRDILLQFLNEAVVLSTLGGLVGLGLGIAASLGITLIINCMTPDTPWPMVISIKAAVLAIAFAVGTGIFFGYYPARRASRMDPIDALRYE